MPTPDKHYFAALQLLNESSFTAVFVTDAVNHIILSVNKTTALFFGFDENEFINSNICSFIHCTENVFDDYMKKRKIRGKVKAEVEVTCKDGGIMECSFESQLFTAGDGKTFASFVFIDNSDKIKYKTTTLRHNRLLTQAEMLGKTGSWQVDTGTSKIEWSSGVYLLLGYEPGSFEPTFDLFEQHILHPDEIVRFGDFFRTAVATKQPFSETFQFIKKNGEVVIALVKGEFYPDTTPQRNKAFGIMQDITEINQYRSRHEFEKRNTEALINSSVDLIWSVDTDFRLITANLAFIHDIQSRSGKILRIGANLLDNDAYPSEYLGLWLKLYTRALSGDSFTQEIYSPAIRGNNGIWGEVSFSPIINNRRIEGVACSRRNITERKKYEANILEVNQRLEAAQKLSAMGYMEMDIKSQSFYWSREVYAILELPADVEPDFKKFISIIFPEEKNFIQKQHLRSFVRKIPIDLEYRIQMPEGRIKYIQEKGDVIKQGEEEKWSYEATIQDVTREKLAEEKQSLLASIVNSSDDAIISVSPNTLITSWNGGAEKLFGYQQQEMIGKFLSVLPSIDLIPQKRTGRQYSKISNLEVQQNNKQGVPIDISLSIVPIIDSKNNISGYSIIARDIRKRKETERSVAETRKRFEAIFNHAGEAILLADDYGSYVQTNPAAANMLGYSTEELLKLSTEKLVHKVQAFNAATKEVWNTFINEGKQDGVVELVRKDGQLIICTYNAVANILPGLHLSILTEITEKEKAQREIVAQRKKINDILSSITDGFYSVDNNWMVTYWNKEAENIFDIKATTILGKKLWHVMQPMDDHVYEQFSIALQTQVAVRFEAYYAAKEKYFEINAYPSQEILSVYIKDITERKRTEDALKLNIERYNMIAKATNDSIWDWNVSTGEVIRPGNKIETKFGFAAVDTFGVQQLWTKQAHPEDWKKVVAKRDASLNDAGASFWEDEYRFLKADGNYVHIYDRGYILRDEQGKAIRVIGSSQDVTKEKEQVNEIIRIQQNLDSLINTTTDQLWSIDTNLRIITANKAFIDTVKFMTGKDVAEGDDVLASTIKEKTDQWRERYKKAMQGESFNVERSVFNPITQQLKYTILSFSPIMDKHKKVSGVACYEKDVTELIQAGKKLEELNTSLKARAEELATSNAELERFAYVASHDLQEPLRMVSSFLQLLKKRYVEHLDATAQQYIAFSVDGAERMKRLINDLLQYSRVGTTSIEAKEVDMNEVIKDVMTVYNHRAEEKEASIIVSELPVVMAGRSAMVHLMQNLVSNALKYNNNKKPEVRIDATDAGDEWIFTVADNGIGIDDKFTDKIFIIFQRLHNKNEYSGTGIGLAICKKIIERYQGRIWVESTLGKGSKFIFTVPKKTKIKST